MYLTLTFKASLVVNINTKAALNHKQINAIINSSNYWSEINSFNDDFSAAIITKFYATRVLDCVSVHITKFYATRELDCTSVC